MAFLALALLAGCTGDEPDEAQGLEQVTYLTGVGLQGREAYVYVAQDKGFFAAAGFDVQVKPGNGTNQNLQLLQGGQADFAVVDITAALIEYGKGTFTDFTVVSAIHQQTLACLMALEGSGVGTAKDLTGKRIAYIPGGVVRVLFEPWAKLTGTDPAGIRWVNMPAQQMAQGLAAGSIDAATQFIVGRPGVEAAAKGRKAVVLPYSEALPELYGNGLAVGKPAATGDPARVTRFNTAVLKGLTYAAEHPDEAAAIFAKYQQAQPVQVAAAEIKLMAPYVKPVAGPAGTIDRAQVERSLAVIREAGAAGAVRPDDVISFALVPKG